ncbi:response regulator [Nitrospira moscoviensis]|nr:response regulator [Nitrospira moscoviensis]
MERILVVEDNDEDFTALARVLNRATAAALIRCRDGEEVLACLDRLTHDVSSAPAQNRPSVILLDLNLPGTDGREVLAHIKRDPLLRSIPVVVFSTSSSPKDVTYCYEQGANGYMVKSVNFSQFEAALRTFTEYWEKAMLLPPRGRAEVR